MNRTLPALLAIILLLSSNARTQMVSPIEALDGVDPVVLLQQGKEVFGKTALSVERGRFRYLFSSPETKTAFEQAPEKYEIQLGGACARMGAPTYGNASDYAVYDGRIYVFGSDQCRKVFVAAPEKYLAPPAAPIAADVAAAARGRELLDRVAAAIAQRTAIDSVAAYSETVAQVQRRGDTDVTRTTRTIWRYPDDGRIERTLSMQGMPMMFATVVTPAAMWNTGQHRTSVIGEYARAALERTLMSHPLALLKARKEAAFEVAALGPGTVDGTPVERVRVRYRGFDATLGIAPASERLHSMELTDRNSAGEFGSYTLIYSDFTNVGGLMLPHAVRALFNGQPDAFRTYTVKSVEVNPTLDPSLFTKPADPGR